MIPPEFLERNEELDRRFQWHPPRNLDVKNAHTLARGECLQLARVFDRLLSEGREKSLAMTKLEEAMFWANASIAREKDET